MSELRKEWHEVHVGEVTCQWCGARWVGRWNGPKHLMTCLTCEKRLFDDDGNLLEPDFWRPTGKCPETCG